MRPARFDTTPEPEDEAPSPSTMLGAGNVEGIWSLSLALLGMIAKDAGLG